MRHILKDEITDGELLFFTGEPTFGRLAFSKDRFNKYFTIIWNSGPNQYITIDETVHEFPSNTLLTLLFNQSFYFEDSSKMIAWQFNREFYCIIDHDREVSCVGFLFSSTDYLFIQLNNQAQQKLRLLSEIFTEEFKTPDHIQKELLLALLKRLIIDATRLAKSVYIPIKKQGDKRFHIIRKFNLLVETHFKTEHSVNFYAEQLFKSPKTLSNLFALFNQKSPSQIIQNRIMMEAKRLLSYTDHSIKHITYELGFEDVSYFSNFFKKNNGISPSEFRNSTRF